MATKVRRIDAGDGAVLRTIRLAALEDAPHAFASTFAAEARFTDEQWAERARAASCGPDQASFLAHRGRRAVGLVGAYRREPGAPAVELVSMWTAPDVRRGGVARALIDAVVDWAAASSATAVELWVTRGNEAAQRLYQAAGFRQTGDVQPLPSDPCKEEVRMTLAISAADRR
jgi:GNAT superfamily N-acetyltransferase